MIKTEKLRFHASRVGLALACGVLFQSLAPGSLRSFEFNGYAQGTTYHIIYYAADSAVTQQQFDSIFSKIDSSLSIYKPYSLISQFNSSDAGIKTDKHLRTVVEKSLIIFEDSGGLFDITVYPIVQAWGFGNEPVSVLPDSGKIKAFMNCVGSAKIYLKNDFLGKSFPCVQIDVNGIAQGYTVDVIADFLEWNRIKDYLVEVGGELRVKGHKQPGQEPMRIGIESPATNKNDKPVMKKIITLAQGAVTTSGTYRKQYKVDNKMISHLMDPKTGYPINNEMISATVIAKDAITADGYDNVLMSLGVKDALLFLQRHKDMEAYLIYHKPDGSVGDIATPGFYKLVKENP
jgi:FAD:protein FMN transferase